MYIPPHRRENQCIIHGPSLLYFLADFVGNVLLSCTPLRVAVQRAARFSRRAHQSNDF